MLPYYAAGGYGESTNERQPRAPQCVHPNEVCNRRQRNRRTHRHVEAHSRRRGAGKHKQPTRSRGDGEQVPRQPNPSRGNTCQVITEVCQQFGKTVSTKTRAKHVEPHNETRRCDKSGPRTSQGRSGATT